MPFFEPLPPEPDLSQEQPSGWRPPLWDRPSEALLGEPVPIVALLAKTDRVAVALSHVDAYPNGFTFEIIIIANPMAPRGGTRTGIFGTMTPGTRRGPRVGFEFADGTRVAAAGSWGELVPQSGPVPVVGQVAKDELGIPTEPIVSALGVGGGGQHFRMGFWCFPLPPPGPMKAFIEWADAHVAETMTMIDADPILDASSRVVTIWDTGTEQPR
jgi:hypothetical protein